MLQYFVRISGNKKITGLVLLFTFTLIPLLGASTVRQREKNIAGYPQTLESPPAVDLNINDKGVRAGLLYDASLGQIIWEKNKESAFAIASLTKMMVGLLAMEDIRSGKIQWNTPVSVTREAVKMRGSRVNLRLGSVLTMEDLLKAALISSGNDAAYLIAQFLGGTEAAFVTRMNRRAAEMLMSSTFYSNSTGMPAPHPSQDNHSSALDYLILAAEMVKHEELLRITGTSTANISQSGRPIHLANHNRLVGTLAEVDGLKTGFTLNAGYCLAATSAKNGHRLIAVVLGFQRPALRNRFVEQLFNKYYENLGVGTLTRIKGQPVQIAQSVSKPLPADPGVKFLTYRVKKGDTLSRIAKKYRCTVADLRQWNGITGKHVAAGKRIKVSKPSSAARKMNIPARPAETIEPLLASAPAALASFSPAPKVVYHTVRPGETLWRIARKYEGVTVKRIMKLNGIRRAQDLKVGTRLKILLRAAGSV